MSHFWMDLTSADFAELDPAKTIAVFPIASIEQHGPHLPVATDTAIAQGMVRTLVERLPEDLDIKILPIQCVGKANEHVHGPGTLSLSAHTLIDVYAEIGASIAAAGLKKMVFINSHGGNMDVMNIVVRELRVRHGMVAAASAWSRFGVPHGLYSDREKQFGIHGGDQETSLMLHFRPDLVRMDKVADFASIAEEMAENLTYLQPTAPHGMGWLAHDLNPAGAVGEAHLATAAKGKLTAEFQVDGFVALLQDLVAHDLAKLFTPEQPKPKP